MAHIGSCPKKRNEFEIEVNKNIVEVVKIQSYISIRNLNGIRLCLRRF